MSKIIDTILVVTFLLGSSYATKELVIGIEEMAVRRIKKGLSKSEPFAQQLTGTKLNF